MKRGKLRAAIVATVPRLCPGGTVVCLGGGPSLTSADVSYCQGKATVIAINDAYRLAPWADVLYACDRRWWDWHHGVPEFRGKKYSLQRASARWPNVEILINTGTEGLEPKPTGLKTGRNSGYQAINLAVHLGAARILLLGYDMLTTPGKSSHWFGEHPDGRQPPVIAFRQKFASLVTPLAKAGIEIINCSRETALECFRRAPLEQVL